MRVLIVVTLITPTGDYGGPVRVALNHARALLDRGHEVVVVGGTRGYDEVPSDVGGVPVLLFPVVTVLPGTGFAGLASPRLGRWLRGNVRLFDIVHIHVARDLITLPAAALTRRASVPYVLQSHGMIDASTNPLAGPLDSFLTRPALRDAQAVLYLTPREHGDLMTITRGAARLEELRNGVPEAPLEGVGRREVLFLARLAPRKRPLLFVEMADELAEDFPDHTFVLVGPDEGEGEAVRARIASSSDPDRIRWEGAVRPEDALERMRGASVYVLPAVDEPYPMSVLEAMSLGIPVVITDSCGLAPIVREQSSGYVTDASLTDLIRATRALLSDRLDADRRGMAGRRAARELLGMDAVVERLESLYSAGSAPR